MIVNREKLSTILEKHKHWINEDCECWENMKANLRDANLRDANLYGADLRGANLRDADLHGADLYGANLRDADLHGADLCCADLHGADLYDANLCCADLHGANLHGANLRDANLRDADLRDANLRDANLYGADLRGAKNLPFIPYACPDTGSFIGYKKANNMIIKLEITEDAKRTSATSRKCRCNKAKVLGIYDYNHNLLEDKEVASDRDKDFIYRVGEVAEVKDFNEDRWNECSTGIHFFINFQEAVKY